MPDIARLDEGGVLVAVETVSPPDHLTDAAARTVALPAGHDMGQRLGAYRYDFIAGASCRCPASRWTPANARPRALSRGWSRSSRPSSGSSG